MPLSNLAIQNARPREKPYKLTDGGGLYLLVQPNGTRLWRMNYRYRGKQKTLALGDLKTVSAKEAREKVIEARKLLDAGDDPSFERRQSKRRLAEEPTFREVAEAFKAKRKEEGAGAAALRHDHFALVDALADYGELPISKVKPRICLESLRRIEKRGASAQRARGAVSRVFRWAIAEDLVETDPAASLGDALLVRPVTHYASPKDPKAIGALVRSAKGYDGLALTRYALLLGMHTFVRPRELRHAMKSEIDLKAATWRIPAEKMKMRRDHIVPLSTQAVDLFRATFALTAPADQRVFPGLLGQDRVMSENTVNSALRRLGYTSDEVVGHGFRSMASTILNESGLFNSDWIERQLAHVEGNSVRAAYNAALYLEDRRRMMQWWSDWLDKQASAA